MKIYNEIQHEYFARLYRKGTFGRAALAAIANHSTSIFVYFS